MEVDSAVLQRALAAFTAKMGSPSGLFRCCGSNTATELCRQSALEIKALLDKVK